MKQEEIPEGQRNNQTEDENALRKAFDQESLVYLVDIKNPHYGGLCLISKENGKRDSVKLFMTL